MAKEINFHLIGNRADGGQTLGNAVGPATLVLKGLQAVHLVPTGGTMDIRRTDEDAVDDVTWPEDLPFSAEGFRESHGSSEQIPSLTINIPVGVTVTGYVEAAFAPEVS